MNYDFVLGLLLTVVTWIAFMVTLGFVVRAALELFCLGFGC